MRDKNDLLRKEAQEFKTQVELEVVLLQIEMNNLRDSKNAEIAELGNQLFDMTDKNAVLRADLEAARIQARQWFGAAIKLHEAISCIIPKTEG